MMAQEEMLSWNELKTIIDELDVACKSYDLDSVRRVLVNAPAGFEPRDNICDLVWSSEFKPVARR
jgi:FlaA1/EpsC-like NDP-sugar epimerase